MPAAGGASRGRARAQAKPKAKNKLAGVSGSGHAKVGITPPPAPVRDSGPANNPKPVKARPRKNKLAGVSGTGTARTGVTGSGKAGTHDSGTLSTIGAAAHIAPLATALASNPLGALTTHAIAAAAGLQGAERAGLKIAKNASREVVDIPLNTPASLYHLGDTALHHPKTAAEETVKPYIDLIKHPGKSLTNNPVGSVLLFSGGKGGAGRAAGSALRHAPSEALRDLGSTAREDATVPGTNLAKRRAYSPDVTKKATQVVRERRAVKKAAADPDRRPSTTMSDPEIRRRVDEHVAASEDIRRHDRTDAVNRAHAAINDTTKGRVRTKARAKPSAATTLAVQGVARSVPELQGYLARLESEGKNLQGPELRANRTAIADVKAAIKAGPSNAAADRYTREVSLPLQAKLAHHGLIDADQAERARLIPYAVSKMAARHDGETLVAHDGKALSNAEIRAHMKETGTPEPGYVTNAPNQRGAKNFYVPTHEPPRLPSGKRTGNAIVRGTADLHPDTLIEGAAKAQGLVTAADRYGAFLKEFAHRKRDGTVRQFDSYQDAKNAALHAETNRHGDPVPGAVKLRPVQINPFAGKGAQLRATLEHANDDAPATKGLADAQDHALSGEEGTGPWTLVPDAAADQMRQHIRVTGTGVPGKTARIVGSRFRQSVLATNPRWLVGNSVEAAARSLMSGVGPGAYALGRGALKRLEAEDPAAAVEARSRMVGGGHLAMNRRVQTFSHADQFAGTKLASTATALGKFWRTPGPKQLAGAWHAYTDFVFNSLNGRIESQFQTAMLGKALRKSPLMDDHIVSLSKRAMDEAARGLKDTNTQVALGREVDRMYGNYGKFSPALRHTIAGYTPFIAWAINATNFLTRVLPQDHPVLTSVLVAANQASDEWRKDHGLKFGEKDAPYFLQGSIPVGSGKLRVAKYTPFGVAQSPSGIPGTFASSLLPQFQSIISNLQGKDWKGKDLPEGQSPLLAAAVSLIEGSVPLAGQTSRVASGDGSLTHRLRKEVDPTMAITSKKPGAAAPASGGSALPAGVSQAEIDQLQREARSASATPAVSDAEIQQLLKEAGR